MRGLRWWLWTVCLLCLGCGPASIAARNPATVTPAAPAAQAAGTSKSAPASPASTAVVGQATPGWHLTVYYTPVESYHGPPSKPIADCAGKALGQHSAEFLDRIQTEGFGRVATPIQGYGYLGWDFDRNCWFMASTPVGAEDRPLRPWVSTAAPATIRAGTRLRVQSCGADVDDSVCARVRSATWTVDDRCSGGCDDPHHVDLYVGEEDRPNFEDQSPSYFETHTAVVTLIT